MLIDSSSLGSSIIWGCSSPPPTLSLSAYLLCSLAAALGWYDGPPASLPLLFSGLLPSFVRISCCCFVRPSLWQTSGHSSMPTRKRRSLKVGLNSGRVERSRGESSYPAYDISLVSLYVFYNYLLLMIDSPFLFPFCLPGLPAPCSDFNLSLPSGTSNDGAFPDLSAAGLLPEPFSVPVTGLESLPETSRKKLYFFSKMSFSSSRLKIRFSFEYSISSSLM